LPDAVQAQQRAAADLQTARQKNPMEKVRLPHFRLSSTPADASTSSSIYRLLLTRWRKWRATKTCRKSNLGMPRVLHHLHLNYRTSLLVSSTPSPRFSKLLTTIFSHAYYSARPVHARCHYSNVQDPCFELPYHCVQSKCAVSRWDKIR
jgi:hypothetical protein